jgi:hypothetical protein
MQLRALLSHHFPDIPPARLPGGFDRVGDIAVVGIVPEVAPWQAAIGNLLLAQSRRVGRGFFLPTKNTSAIGSLCPDANQSPGGGHQLPFPPCLFYEKKTVAGLCEPVHRFHFELTDCGLTIHGQIMHPSADAGHCRRGR